MKHLAVLIALSALAPGQTLSPDTKAWVASKLYSGIQLYFAHAEGAPEFNLDHDFQQYLKAAFASDDRRAFDLASMAFMGKLRNGHSFFYDDWLYKNYGQPLGFTLRPMAEGWVIETTRLPDLIPGDIVLSVDGKPIEQFYAAYDGMVEGSSETTRRHSFSWQTHLWPGQFELSLAGGKRVSIDRRRQKLGPTRGFPTSQAELKTPEGVVYLRISSFEDPKAERAMVRRVKGLGAAKALIFDVRGNGGGASPSQLLAALLDRPWRDFRYTTPFSIAHAGAENRVREIVPNLDQDQYLKGYLDAFEEFKDTQVVTPGALHPAASNAYKGKVILIVDEYCNSACEDFAEPFHSSRRGTLVGHATNGSSGQPYLFDFGNGMSFRVSSKRYYLPDGTPFEGVGIKPDVEVIPTLDDFKAGRDPMLAKALELASQ